MIAKIMLWLNDKEVEEAERLNISVPSKEYNWEPVYIDEEDIKIVWPTSDKNLMVTMSSGVSYKIKADDRSISTLKKLSKLPIDY